MDICCKHWFPPLPAAASRGNTSECVCVWISVSVAWMGSVLTGFIISYLQISFGARIDNCRRANNGRAHGTLWRNDTTERWVSIDGELLLVATLTSSFCAGLVLLLHALNVNKGCSPSSKTESTTVITVQLQRINNSGLNRSHWH